MSADNYAGYDISLARDIKRVLSIMPEIHLLELKKELPGWPYLSDVALVLHDLTKDGFIVITRDNFIRVTPRGKKEFAL